MALDGFTGLAGCPGDGVNATNAAGAGSARVYQFQYDLGPRLALSIPDQVVTIGTGLNFTVDASTFGDPAQMTFTRISSTQVTLALPKSSDFPQGRVHVEWSPDRVTWHLENVVLTENALTNPVTVTAVATAPSAQSKMFTRIVVSE